MSQISNDWLEALKPEFAKPYYRDLYKFVDSEYRKGVVYPPSEDIFNAFNFTPLKNVKVLILGQDPYHNELQAHGLSFSVLPEQKDIPPSLQNIYQERWRNILLFTMTLAVMFLTMVILKNGRIRVCFF